MNLNQLKIGQSAKIASVGGEGSLRQHFLDMGVIPGAEITLVKFAPMGDPMEFIIHGYELTLRVDDAKKIAVTEIIQDEKTELDAKSNIKNKNITKDEDHLGLGEGGKYHQRKGENPLPKDTVITFALAGNQNCGKTTLFNQLTGSNQHVGNFPGVTVDKKDGVIRKFTNTLVTDLPGIYSMSPYSAEEIVTREFILTEKPKGIINIVDANNIERNLYLTMQLIELDCPMVLALNMMDEVTKNHGAIDVNKLEHFLGIPVVPISAVKNQGIDELISHALHVATYQEKPGRLDFCDENDNGGAVHRALHAVMHLVQDHAEKAKIPIRFAASKIIEGDHLIIEKLCLEENEKEMIEHIASQMEEESGLDRNAAMAEMRFNFIGRVSKECVIKPKESKEHERSSKIDKILTGKWSAIPMFVLIMALVFFLTFNLIGGNLQTLLEHFIDWLMSVTDAGLTKLNVNKVLHSLIVDGILNGVGSVLSFLPIIVTLFLFLSLLEDSGYIARVAFVMDKLLRRIGLSGRSIVPMLIGFGCTVPAVMASRTLPSERDRKMTILLTPFMSCSAKLPIYSFFCSAFFPKHAALVMIVLYFGGIIMGILVAKIFKHTIFKGEAIPFVMELPNYRMPGVKNVAMLLWEKTKDFLQRAFTIIFLATIVIWFLQSFDLKMNFIEDSSTSLLAMISGWIAPIFKPLGFGDWRFATALVTGFIAKESVVSTLKILFGSAGAIMATISSGTALSLLTFCLLYTPCIASVASVRRELGTKWMLFVIFGQILIAWIVSFVVKLLSTLIF